MLLGSPLGSLGRGHAGAMIRPSAPVPFNRLQPSGSGWGPMGVPAPGPQVLRASPTVATVAAAATVAACARPTQPGPQPIAPSWQKAEDDREARRKVIATLQAQLNAQGQQMQQMAAQLDQATRALTSASGACARPTPPAGSTQGVAPSWQAAENDRWARKQVIDRLQAQLNARH